MTSQDPCSEGSWADEACVPTSYYSSAQVLRARWRLTAIGDSRAGGEAA